jgi:hypothetical protein
MIVLKALAIIGLLVAFWCFVFWMFSMAFKEVDKDRR